jgi:hypothetical protein
VAVHGNASPPPTVIIINIIIAVFVNIYQTVGA